MDKIPSAERGLLPWIAALAGRVTAFRKELLAADTWPPAAVIGVELDRALTALEVPPAVPALVVMLGGTGVGKSELFNALLGIKDASPSSDTVRCHTSQPHLAVHLLDRPHLPALPGLNPVLVEGGVPRGVVLADTPDVDGMVDRHHAVTRQMLERADLVLFVSDPDRRANLQVLQELRLWAPRKRWLFVLTKADKYPGTIHSIAADFNKRLLEIGFADDPESRFMVASVQANDPGLSRLRQAVLSPGDENRMPLLRQDAFLRQASHALVPVRLQPLAEQVGRLKTLQNDLGKKRNDAYLEALGRPQAANAFVHVVRQAAWRELGERSGPFLFPAVWMRSRMQPLATGWALSRGLRGGLLGVAGALGASALWALRGLSPLRHIAQALGQDYLEKLKNCDDTARRTLEDASLDHLARAGRHGDGSQLAENRPETVGGLGATVDGFLKQWTLADVPPALLERVEADVESAGRESARLASSGVVGMALLLVGNMLVAGMIGWVAWRLAKSWWLETDLSTVFFLQAATLILISFLPGLLLLAWRVAGQVNPRRLRHLLSQNPTPVAGGQLDRVHQTLCDWHEQGQRLARSLGEAQKQLRADLGTDATWGASLPASESAVPSQRA